MDQDTANALAGLRYQLAQLRSALGVQTADQAEHAVRVLKDSVGSVAGSVGGLEDSIGTLNGSVDVLHGSVANLDGSVGTLQQDNAGLPWNPLTMPPGARGTAQYRKAPGGQLDIQIALTWRVAPGTAVLYGVPAGLWPPQAYESAQEGTSVSVAANGTVTIITTGTAVNAHLLVPLH